MLLERSVSFLIEVVLKIAKSTLEFFSCCNSRISAHIFALIKIHCIFLILGVMPSARHTMMSKKECGPCLYGVCKSSERNTQ